MNDSKGIFFLIASFTLLRLGVAPTFGLGVDEAHYLLYAVHLDLSYVDHPPLVGWIHAALYTFLGTNELLARLPAILLFALVSFLAYRFTLSFSNSKKISLLAVWGLNSSFLMNALSLMLLPDSILLVLILLLIFVIQKMEAAPLPKYFVYLGLLWGLAGLTKYTSALLVPPLIVYWILKKRYDLLFSKHMLTCAAIAFLLISPVLYWNLKHDWVSFRYQGAHLFGAPALSFKPFLLSLAAQAGSYSPFLFAIAVYGFFKSMTPGNERIRLPLFWGGTLWIFFLLSSLYDLSLPHWSSPFYLLFIPIGLNFLSVDAGRMKRNLRNFSLGFSLILTLFLYAELAGKWFAFPDYQSPFRDIYGWDTVAQEADRILQQDPTPRKALAVTEWTLGSRMMYYSLPYHREVFVIDQRRDQFDLWQKNSPWGYNLLFVHSYFSREDIGKKFQCDEVRVAKKMDILLNGGKVEEIEYVWCRHFRGAKDGNR
jgi:4-amino-4-deoxy-L-arabinose transferase-like glycosyltransferase